MKRTFLAFLTLALGLAQVARAQTTALTYQGKLTDNGSQANGNYDLQFRLYNDATLSGPANLLASYVVPNPVQVGNGVFTVQIDFGSGPFTGPRRWLEVDARVDGSQTWTTLSPRTELTPVPYAIYAQTAGTVVGGAIGSAQLAANSVANGNLQANSVSSGNIASGQVVKSLNGLMDAVNLTAGANISLTPSGNDIQISAVGAGSGWSLTGNSGTSPGVNFLGTTDGQPLLLKSAFTGVNRSTRITGAEYFGVRAPVTNSYGGMYVETAGSGLPFYGYAMQGGASAWHYVDGSDTNKWKLWVNGPRLTVDRSGGVGIDTTTPAYTLDVAGQINSTGGFIASSAYSGSYGTVMSVPFYSRTRLLSSYWNSTVGDYVDLEVPGNDGSTNLLRITSHGGVGVGVTDPGFALDVLGRIRIRDGSGGVGAGTAGLWLNTYFSPNGGGNADIGFIGVMDATRIGFYGNDPRGGSGWGLSFDTVTGNVGIGTGTSYPTYKLQVAGDVSVQSLTITGGSDVAEPFHMPEGTPKGAVVVIDEEHPGHLKISEHAYDSHVAGIVSGADGINPGLSLHQDGVLEGGKNVALSGRVKVIADASNGSIKPGDLLTTSDVPGYCMKVTDHAKAQGAILGKAMGSLEKGKGMVLVLVSLQ